MIRVSSLKAGRSRRIEANNNPVNFRDAAGLSPNLGNVADDYYGRPQREMTPTEEAIVMTVLETAVPPIGATSDVVRILSDGPEPSDALNLVPLFKLLKGAKKVKKICDLDLLHSKDLIENSADYKRIRNLSDSELLDSVNSPTNRDFLTVNQNTGRLVDGNTRAYELQRRSLLPGSSISPNTQVPVRYHNPSL